MKTNLFLSTALILILLACGHRSETKSGTDTVAAITDSIEATITFRFTHPYPPYSDYDSTFKATFSTQKEFAKWKAVIPAICPGCLKNVEARMIK